MPSLISLPSELLLDIIEYLGYREIRISLPATCRQLRSISTYAASTPTSSLARTLFREEFHPVILAWCNTCREEVVYEACIPNVVISNNRILKLNPRLKLLVLRESNMQTSLFSVDNIGIINGLGNFIPLKETTIARETLTTPPIDQLSFFLDLDRRRRIAVGSIDFSGFGTAITILDLTEAIEQRFKDMWHKGGEFMTPSFDGRSLLRKVWMQIFRRAKDDGRGGYRLGIEVLFDIRLPFEFNRLDSGWREDDLSRAKEEFW